MRNQRITDTAPPLRFERVDLEYPDYAGSTDLYPDAKNRAGGVPMPYRKFRSKCGPASSSKLKEYQSIQVEEDILEGSHTCTYTTFTFPSWDRRSLSPPSSGKLVTR